MKFKTFLKMRSSPNFKVDANMEPLCISAAIDGALLDIGISAVSVSIGAIPIRASVPFLKRRGKVLMASVGGFRARFQPMQFKLNCPKANISGTIGEKGIKGSMDFKVACRTEADMCGEVTGKTGAIRFDLGEEESVCGDRDDNKDVRGKE